MSTKKAVVVGLAHYLAMGAGRALGWWCHVWIYDHPIPPATGGLAANILECFAFAWTVLLAGPLIVSGWIVCYLFAPGSGVLCFLFLLVLAAAQYALLFFVLRDIFRGRTRLRRCSCGIFLAAYSFLYSFALLYVGSII